MKRVWPVLGALLLFVACDNTSPDDAGPANDAGPGGGLDAGPAVDAGPGTGDAGPGPGDAGPGTGDAGPGGPDGGPGMCGSGAPMPTPFDCATEDPPLTFGAPITAPDSTWTWVDFPGSRCMDGSATGIGVNLSSTSNRVMIFLEGGGACFDSLSCLGVANPNGFDGADFATITGTALSRGIFDRTDTNNPIRDWNMIYVPYCTGDVHAGTNAAGPSGRQHVGYLNMQEYLARIVPTFPSATQVLLTGRSAGGLGALMNHEQTQRAFDCVRVDAFSDSGGPLPDMFLRPCLQATVREVWGLNAAIPSGCVECGCQSDGGGLINVYPYLARRFPMSRVGFLSTTGDSTMRGFYGYGYSAGCNFPGTMPAADYEAGLNGVRAATNGITNFHTFYLGGTSHTFTGSPLGGTMSGGTTLGAWLDEMVNDAATWSDVGP